MNRHDIQKVQKIPRLIYWICGAVIVFLFVGWSLLGIHSRDTLQQRLSSPTKPSPSTIPKVTNAPSRMIVGEPIKARLSSQDNAANDWRKAFALMDKLTDREKALLKDKSPTDPAPTDDEIASLLEKIAPIIALLRAGAAKPECDWGVYSHSFWTNTSQDDQGFLLGKIALWDSVRRVGTEPQAAVENTIAMAKLGNSLHLGFHNEVIHSRIFDFLSSHTNSFSGSDRERMQPIIGGTDFVEALQVSTSGNLDEIKNTIRAFQTVQKTDGSHLTEMEIKDFRDVFGTTSSEVPILEQMQEISEVLGQSVYWKDDKFQSWLADYQRRNPVGAPWSAAGDSGRLRSFYRKVLVSQQMVNVGWAVMQEGQTAISRLRDPLTGKPFRYRQIDEQGSFELQSEVFNNGTPIIMTFPGTGR